MPEIDYRTLLLQLCASLTLCDHLGDVLDDVLFVLRALEMEPAEWDDLADIGRALGQQGITTLYGTSLGEEDEDDA
jgi:hypothetical protein